MEFPSPPRQRTWSLRSLHKRPHQASSIVWLVLVLTGFSGFRCSALALLPSLTVPSHSSVARRQMTPKCHCPWEFDSSFEHFRAPGMTCPQAPPMSCVSNWHCLSWGWGLNFHLDVLNWAPSWFQYIWTARGLRHTSSCLSCTPDRLLSTGGSDSSLAFLSIPSPHLHPGACAPASTKVLLWEYSEPSVPLGHRTWNAPRLPLLRTFWSPRWGRLNLLKTGPFSSTLQYGAVIWLRTHLLHCPGASQPRGCLVDCCLPSAHQVPSMEQLPSGHWTTVPARVRFHLQ